MKKREERRDPPKPTVPVTRLVVSLETFKKNDQTLRTAGPTTQHHRGSDLVYRRRVT